jgi:hypothetical protein
VREKLPKGAGGVLPRFDGEPFHIGLSPGVSAGASPSEEQVRSALEQILAAAGWARDPKELGLTAKTALPSAKAEVVEGTARQKLEEDQKRISGQVGPLSAKTKEAIERRNREFKEQISRAQAVYVFEQRVDGVPIDNCGVLAIWQQGRGVVGITGAVFTRINISNSRILKEAEAIAAAKRYLARSTQVLDQPAPHPEMVILPYGKDMRYAWRFEIRAKEGPYAAWIDSQTGKVLQLLPRFFNDAAQGLVSHPAPTAGNTEVLNFEVDPPAQAGANYTLSLASGATQRITLTNLGKDGQGTALASVPSGGGSANFNVAPINGTVVSPTSNASYNTFFQQVNAFAWVHENTANFESYGSQKFPPMTVTVNDGNACGYGLDNSCESDDSVDFSIGSATLSQAGGFCGALLNGAIDATVVTHEWGHKLTALQVAVGGGTTHSSMNEGLSDFWAATVFNNPVFGGWWANGRAPVETGCVPRQADSADAFPSHRNIGGVDMNAEAHADGQIVDWALWQTRYGLNDISVLGTLVIDTDLLKALTSAGKGITDGTTDQSVEAAYVDLLTQLAIQFGSSSDVNKLLAGFAQAGIFLSDRDAVIDIDHDYLARGSATGPTFTIWTGRNYTFDGSGNAVLNQNVFNTQLTVEVANDKNFTVNHVSSGVLGGVTNSAAGVPTATWTLPPADWNTLKSGDSLYYRVTTTDSNGQNSCVSTSPGCGSGPVQPVDAPSATINQTGTCQCSAAPGAPSGRFAWPILAVLVAAYAYRWSLRKRTPGDAATP